MYEKIKISEVDINIAKNYLRIDDECEDEEIIALSINGAIDYIKNYTNLSIEELDQMSSMTIAMLILVSDFYENRGLQIESNTKVNRMLGSILSMNRDLG